MINFFSRKVNLYIIDCFILIICIAGIYQVAEKAGINTLLKYSSQKIVIIKNNSATIKQSLRPGDVILAIDDHQVSTIEDIEFILDSYAVGQSAEFQIKRDHALIKQKITLEPVSSVSYLTALFLVGIIFLALGVFVLKKRPQGDIEALVFHWISATVCIHIMTTFGRYTIPPIYLGYFLRIVFLLASALTPILFVHFSFLFPRIKWGGYKKVIRILYILAIFYFFYLSSIFLQASLKLSIESFHNFMISYNIGRWFFALCLFFGVANIIHSYLRALEESERRKLRWVILGLAIGPISFVALWQIPQTLTSVALVPEEFILFTSAITPLTFAISIVRYHVLDIDFIFNRSTVYFIVLSIILIIYAVLVALAAFIIGTITIKISLIISAIAAVIVALLFEPARRKVQKFVDRKFFRVQYNYRLAQREFTYQINRFMELRSLAQFVVDRLNELLQTELLSFVLLNESAVDWKVLAATNNRKFNKDIKKELTNFTDRSLNPLMAVTRYIETGIIYEVANAEVFKNNQIVLALPLRLQNTKNSGFLLLGRKKARTRYSFEDIDLIKTVASQSSFAIERIRLQQDLLLQHAETKRLDELNRLKTYFVSSVSHDLQTPLTSIKMFAELLQTKQKISQNEKQEFLEIIQGESERLSRLINNVLDFARVERGEKKYNIEEININKIIASAIRIMKYQLKQNGFELEIKIPQEKIFIWADADAIIEALTNLISNAIKYSDKIKFISVSMSLDKNFVIVQVKDKGLGISEKDQKRIFETFYRSEEKKIQAMGGAGLGLTLVRHIAEAHQGSITVESKLGVGSTFSLYLPLGERK